MADFDKIFLSTLSLRRATDVACGYWHKLHHFYPRSPCGERPAHFARQIHKVGISIHALLAESDTPKLSRVVPTPIFLSTLSLRRATIYCHCFGTSYSNFYPRSPCGERLAGRGHVAGRHQISIHALLAESDAHFARQIHKVGISIHALLAESDPRTDQTPPLFLISIHALLAESDNAAKEATKTANISIHALLAESDTSVLPTIPAPAISIHALLAESDSIHFVHLRKKIYFYPRSPCGERHNAGPLPTVCRDFYPRSPCGERPGGSTTFPA